MPSFSSTLLQWYAENGRTLPWRDISDPYRIWISEIILQQTRVAQGYDYYLRFINRFPTVEQLAAATQDEVMRLWEGLGYYSRARNLHAAARQVVGQGGFPKDYAGVRALKGVGDYTAAAICSFAYHLPTAVVDGNVYRVLSRYFGIDTPIDTTEGKKLFSRLAQELLDEQQASAYNQAIMDFGAVQCTPRSPRCLLCPFADSCVALAEGRVELLPVKSKKIAVTHRYFVYVVLTTMGGEEENLYLRRRAEGDIWAGLYEPLLLEFPHQPSVEEIMSRLEQMGVVDRESTLRPITEKLRHQLTHRLLHADAFSLRHPRWIPEGFIAVPWSELRKYAFPKLVSIVLEKLEFGRGQKGCNMP